MVMSSWEPEEDERAFAWVSVGRASMNPYPFVLLFLWEVAFALDEM